MYDNYIDLLESKYMEPKLIAKIQKYLIFYSGIKDATEKINFIYEIMGFAGLSNKQIEKLFDKCISIIRMPYEEITKIACCLWQTDSVDEIFNFNKTIPLLCNYKRLFMRYLVIKNSKTFIEDNMKIRHSLMASDNYFYGQKGYKFDSKASYRISSDAELEANLDRILTLNGKPITVDEYIDYITKKFYVSYLNNKRNRNARIRK